MHEKSAAQSAIRKLEEFYTGLKPDEQKVIGLIVSSSLQRAARATGGEGLATRGVNMPTLNVQLQTMCTTLQTNCSIVLWLSSVKRAPAGSTSLRKHKPASSQRSKPKLRDMQRIRILTTYRRETGSASIAESTVLLIFPRMTGQI